MSMPVLILAIGFSLHQNSDFKPSSGAFFLFGFGQLLLLNSHPGAFHKGPKKGLNFAKFHTRGGRGRQRAHPRIEVPLPPGTGRVPGRRRYRAVRGAATPDGGLPGHTPGGAATRRRAAYTGRYGAHVGRGYPGRAYTGRRGYRAKQAAFRGARGRLPGARGYPGGARRATYTGAAGLCRGCGLYRAGYPRAGRGGTAYPRRGGGYPAGYRGERC